MFADQKSNLSPLNSHKNLSKIDFKVDLNGGYVRALKATIGNEVKSHDLRKTIHNFASSLYSSREYFNNIKRVGNWKSFKSVKLYSRQMVNILDSFLRGRVDLTL